MIIEEIKNPTDPNNGLLAKWKEKVLKVINEIDNLTDNMTELNMTIQVTFGLNGLNIGIVEGGFSIDIKFDVSFKKGETKGKIKAKANGYYQTGANGIPAVHDAVTTIVPPITNTNNTITTGEVIQKILTIFPSGTQVKFDINVGAKIGADFSVVDFSTGFGFGLKGTYEVP